MDFIDYRKALGIGFSNIALQKVFMNRIQVFLQSHPDISFTEEQETRFCYQIGVESKLENREFFDMGIFGTEPRGLQRAWLYLKSYTGSFPSFLAIVITLYNSYEGLRTNKNEIFKAIKQSLEDSHISYNLVQDEDGIFIFPKGAKELDDALVSEPLEWLKEYQKAHKTYCIALKQYSDGEYIRDTADNLRKALEEFLQEFLKNDKNLETNKNEICKYLGANGVDAGICGLFQPLINSYKNINDRMAKHNDRVDSKLLEFLLYQTGVLIRMVLSVEKAKTED